jgi:hypothetical protein
MHSTMASSTGDTEFSSTDGCRETHILQIANGNETIIHFGKPTNFEQERKKPLPAPIVPEFHPWDHEYEY